MPKVELERAIVIGKPVAEVFNVVSDLGNWRPWNPWLVTEADVKLDVSPDGKFYSWKGKLTGAGEMRITDEVPGERIDLDLTFVEPFKSKAKVYFLFEPTAEGTRVSWGMDSKLPFFLFFMTKLMKNMIGMDYQRGLTMLKDYCETGTVPSKIELKGQERYPGCDYVGITTECPIDELSEAMSRDFAKLKAWFDTRNVRPAADAFSAYHKWDLSSGRVRYTSGVPVEGAVSGLPTGLETGKIPSLDTFVLDHVGEYRHLGNAWACGMQLGRTKQIRTSKAYPPFETYPIGPGGLPEAGQSSPETRVSLHFAVK